MIRVYDSDKYLVRMYNDGVDTSATVQPKNVMMPSLKVNKDNAFIDFPINGYGIEDVDDLIKSLTDISEFMEMWVDFQAKGIGFQEPARF